MNCCAKVAIRTLDYYDKPLLYRYMNSSMFDALESAYLDGDEYTEVLESDLFKLNHQLIIKIHGSQSN